MPTSESSTIVYIVNLSGDLVLSLYLKIINCLLYICRQTSDVISNASLADVALSETPDSLLASFSWIASIIFIAQEVVLGNSSPSGPRNDGMCAWYAAAVTDWSLIHAPTARPICLVRSAPPSRQQYGRI